MSRVALRRLPVVVVTALAVFCAEGLFASAGAALDADDLQGAAVVKEEVSIVNFGSGGGYVACPAGTRALTGGAFWDPDDNVTPAEADDFYTSSSTPTTDGKGWYAAGANLSGGNAFFERHVNCVPKRKLRGAEIRTRNFRVAYGESGGGRARCPDGTRAFGGGAFWHAPGQPPDANSASQTPLFSSFPTADRRGWYADGKNMRDLQDDYVLTAVVRCLSPNRLATVKVRTSDHALVNGATAGGVRECPADTVPLTGGGYRHLEDEGPDRDDGELVRLSSLSPSDLGTGAPGSGYYTDSYNGSGLGSVTYVFTNVAHCLGG